MTKCLTLLLVLILSPALCRAQTTRPAPEIQAAVVISIDGLRPDLLLRAKAPTLRALLDDGSFTLYAETTDVAITLPSHTSMITGVKPEKHKVTWNADLPPEKQAYPAVPTLLELAKKSGYTTAILAGKTKFVALAREGTVDWSDIRNAGDEEIARRAAALIKEHRPQVLYIHLPDPDTAGHAEGWGTPAQLAAVEKCDQAVATILAALDETNLRAHTAVLVSADHGGAGRNHGANDPRSRYIPWIISGPGLRKNLDLTTFADLTVHTEDTFATLCWLLALPVPPEIDGKPVQQILHREQLLQDTAERK